MSTTTLPERRPRWRAGVLGAWAAWSGPRPARLARGLTLAALALLFLQAAATVDLGFTVRVSYVLLAAACAVGAPFVVRGWLRLPSWVAWLAVAVLAAYLLAAALSDPIVVSTLQRASSRRMFVYLTDLVLGLAVIGLIVGLWADRDDLGLLVRVLVAGAVLAALYGIYQWIAVHANLPFKDIDNAVNTDGVTRGSTVLGPGPFGGERIRSTFIEPHFAGAFFASMLPLAAALAYRRRTLARLAAVAVIGFALLLTGSTPAVGALFTGVLVGAAALAVATGRVIAAGAAGVAVVLALLVGGTAIIDPTSLSSVTGRSQAELSTTANFRVHGWERVLDAWAERPVEGYGPGQGPVRLSRPGSTPGAAPILGTAQGLWASALLEGGVVAFGFWVAFLGGLLAVGVRGVVRRAGPLAIGILAATTAAVISSQVAGDRLDTRVWVLLGLLAVLSCGAAERHRDERREGTE